MFSSGLLLFIFESTSELSIFELSLFFLVITDCVEVKDDSEKDVAEINELYIEGNLLLDFFLDEADSFFCV